MNIADLVFERASHPSRNREALALISPLSPSGNYTFAQLEEAVDHAAEKLLAAGMPHRKPDRVFRIGLACPNGPEHVILALAVLRTGGCLVPIASELAIPEREAVIRTVALDAVILSDKMPWPERFREPGCAVAVPGLDATLFIDLPPSPPAPLASPDSGLFDEAALARLDPAFIRFSSGTTGRAKGVILSHAALLDRVEGANRRLRIGPEDRVIWILAMAHHFAVSIMLYLLNGATTVIVGSHLAEEVLTAGRNHGGTVLYGAPFHHSLLAAEPSGRPWPTLRLAVSTAAPLPSATAKAFYARYGLPLSQGLGIIEVGLPFLNTTAALEKPDSVGLPTPEVSVELRDVATGRPIPASACEVGELFIRCPGMLDAYLNPWQPREAILAPGGWFCTGDLGQLDHDGYLYLVGRTKSVINVAGMKCFPEEVEAVLQGHPAVRAVRVSGREHPRFGAVPVAEIIPDPEAPLPTAAALVAYCRKALAAYKVPVDFKFVRELPRTASGKIRR